MATPAQIGPRVGTSVSLVADCVVLQTGSKETPGSHVWLCHSRNEARSNPRHLNPNQLADEPLVFFAVNDAAEEREKWGEPGTRVRVSAQVASIRFWKEKSGRRREILLLNEAQFQEVPRYAAVWINKLTIVGSSLVGTCPGSVAIAAEIAEQEESAELARVKLENYWEKSRSTKWGNEKVTAHDWTDYRVRCGSDIPIVARFPSDSSLSSREGMVSCISGGFETSYTCATDEQDCRPVIYMPYPAQSWLPGIDGVATTLATR